MPLIHCSKCDHEWETINKAEVCDWCQSPGKVLEEKTPMEKVNWRNLAEKFNKLSEESKKTGKPIIMTTQKKKRKK